MKFLVTGANGYLGRGVVRQLLDDGHEVVAVGTHLPTVDERAICMKEDVFALEDPFNTLGRPDAVMHFAWRDVFKHNSLYHIESLPGHYSFLRRMAEGGARRICAMGTSHEVGPFVGRVEVDTPCNPSCLYGIGKNTMRSMVQQITDEFDIMPVWLRGFTTVGNEEARESVYSKLLKADREGRTSFPFVKGENKQDYTDYGLFCEMIAAAIEQDKVGGIIQICSGTPIPLRESVERFIRENGLNIKLDIGAYPDRPFDSPEMWGNNELISKIMDERRAAAKRGG